MEMHVEAKWSEVLFSYITAGWYDWAVSKNLFYASTNCWSITSGYSSHYTLSASLVALYRGDAMSTEDILELVQDHVRFRGFLKNENDRTLRETYIKDMSGKMRITEQELAKKLIQLGEMLDLGEKAHMYHSQQVMVVSHQTMVKRKRTDSSIQALVEKRNQQLIDTAAKINSFIIDMTLNVIISLDESIKHYHLKNFKEEIEDFYNLLILENVPQIPDRLSYTITKIIRQIESEWNEAKCPNYEQFKQCLTSFHQEWAIYKKMQEETDSLETTILEMEL